MIKMSLFKIIISFGALFSQMIFSEAMEKLGVSEQSKTSITVISEKYKEDFLVFPQVKNLDDSNVEEKINKTLFNHIEQSFEEYLQLKNEMEEYKKEVNCDELFPSCEYSYNTDFEVKFDRNGKLSILIYDSIYSGGAHGITPLKAYNFDLQTGDKLTLKDIVRDTTKFASITDYAKKYMKEHEDIFFSEDYLEDFSVNEETQFYFTDEGINLIFQQYEVAPYASGHPTIPIPISLLQ